MIFNGVESDLGTSSGDGAESGIRPESWVVGLDELVEVFLPMVSRNSERAVDWCFTASSNGHLLR